MIYEKITENVYAISDGSTRGNVAAYVLPTQIVFIDSGMNIPVVQQFRDELEKETGKKTTTLILTHTHFDHLLGIKVFADCKIIASRDTFNRVTYSMENEWPARVEEMLKNPEMADGVKGFEAVNPTDYFDKEYIIEDQDVKLIIKQTGGHTSGSSYVYYPESKVLTAGDNLFIGMFPWGGDQDAHPEKWVNALKEYIDLNLDFYIPGHGKVIQKEGIQEFHDYLQKVIVLMRKKIAQGFGDDKIIAASNEIEYYAPRSQEWKDLSLKKWLAEIKK
ncbi:MAG: MBL fold metallo-hydrolase [Candidatus Heimdallarchaeota archaeon]